MSTTMAGHSFGETILLPLFFLLNITAMSTPVPSIRPLPDTILLGYATRCDYEKVKRSVVQGVNVVAWAFFNMPRDFEKACAAVSGPNQEESGDFISQEGLDTGFDIPCIRRLIQSLDDEGYDDVVHLTSLGGWNGPHLDPDLSADAWYKQWKKLCGSTFHGLDWDLEGNDDLKSPYNVFTKDCLDKMGEISRMAKKDGYIVSMAPAQSYLDFPRSRFSRYVNLTDPTRGWHDDFSYFGANAYAYVLARFEDAIDLISMQFYESYSQAACAIRHKGMTPHEYLIQYIQEIKAAGEAYLVDFSSDPSVEMPSQKVRLPLSKLLLGLANGWAHDSPKAIYISSAEVKAAYSSLVASGHELPRGIMFWLIDEEGNNDVFLTPGLNDVLHIRSIQETEVSTS